MLQRQISIWLKALRVGFLTATVVPVLLGSVIAWHGSGEFNWVFFLLALLGGVFINLRIELGQRLF